MINKVNQISTKTEQEKEKSEEEAFWNDRWTVTSGLGPYYLLLSIASLAFVATAYAFSSQKNPPSDLNIDSQEYEKLFGNRSFQFKQGALEKEISEVWKLAGGSEKHWNPCTEKEVRSFLAQCTEEPSESTLIWSSYYKDCGATQDTAQCKSLKNTLVNQYGYPFVYKKSTACAAEFELVKLTTITGITRFNSQNSRLSYCNHTGS